MTRLLNLRSSMYPQTLTNVTFYLLKACLVSGLPVMPNNPVTMLWLWNGPLWLPALTPQLRYYFENCGAFQGWSLDGRSRSLSLSSVCSPVNSHCCTPLWAKLICTALPYHDGLKSQWLGVKLNFPALKSSWHVFWSQQRKVTNTGIKSTCCFGFGLVLKGFPTIHWV